MPRTKTASRRKRRYKKSRTWKLSKHGGVVLGPHTAPKRVSQLVHPGGADVVPIKFTGPNDATAATVATDGGGSKLSGASVNLIFWGSGWDTNPSPVPSLGTVANDAASILAGPYLSSLLQYGVAPAHFQAAYLVTSPNPPNPFTTGDVQNLITDLIEGGTLPEPDEELGPYFHCVMMPPGAAFKGGGFNGLHTYAEYTDLDWFDLDWQDKSHMGWVLFGSRAFISSVFSHELAEACSDPEGDGIQITPRNSSNWNEIGDVCATLRTVNGVTVQSYWSEADKACVIPMDVPVVKEIMCVHKVPRFDPHHPIRTVGGINRTTGQPFTMSQEQCIREIDRGNKFFVRGSDGSKADVKVFIHFPPWGPRGIRYIATVADTSKADNLLSLPECPSRR